MDNLGNSKFKTSEFRNLRSPVYRLVNKVQLKDVVKDFANGLDTNMKKSGSNLSVGQKQLICLARAILKRSKIIIIDEATANVDYRYV